MTSTNEALGLNVRRVSVRAYEMAIESARRAAASAGDTVAAEVWAELEEVGIAAGGQLTPQWENALAAAPNAPVQLRVVATLAATTFETDVVLPPGLGLATTQRAVERDEDTVREPFVEMVAFPPEQVWQEVRRVLPPIDVVRADPRPTTPSGRRAVPVPDEVREHLARQSGEGNEVPGQLPSALLEGQDEWHRVVAGGDAQVGVTVAANLPGKGVVPLGVHRWVVVGDALYAVDVASGSVARVEAGAIAYEVVYLVTGAYTAVAARMNGEATR